MNNSGGPLLNAAGQVVGVNSQIYSRSGGYMGLSFAIPADVAMKVADQLRTTGKVQHGRLGVGIQSVNQALAQSFGLPDTNGALIGAVEDWTSGVPLDVAVQRIDPEGSNPYVQANAAGFRAGAVQVTVKEYDIVVSLRDSALGVAE